MGGAGRTHTSGDFQYTYSSNAVFTLTKYIGKGGDVIISPNFQRIKEDAFANCTGLTSVQIPGCINKIYDYAFQNCKNLHAVYSEGDAPVLGYNVFEGALTIYYHTDKSGWSSPTWNGYPTKTY